MAEPYVSLAALRIIKLLVGKPPQTVADLIEATGVTRTAVTEQLNELVAGGFVEKTTEPASGRGRPKNLYEATEDAHVVLMANRDSYLGGMVWRAVDTIGDKKLINRLIDEVSNEVVARYADRVTGTTPQARLKQITELFRKDGVLIDVETKKGKLVINKRNCQFVGWADPSRIACRVDLAAVEKLIGTSAKQIAHRKEDGSSCCSFQVEAK